MRQRGLWREWFFLCHQGRTPQMRDSLRQGTIADSPQGFSLIEVMAAMMIAMIFLSITLQVLVSATVLRMRADQFDSAVNWIQDDLETVVNRAGRYEMEKNPNSDKCAAIDSANGLAAGFINDATRGLGGTSTTLGSKQVADKTLMLTRTASVSAEDPLRLVQLVYTVMPQGGGAAVASMTTEVLPYAVLKCP
jgi:prepilin-type N-terminal cleavage/methylation domain-containing protein